MVAFSLVNGTTLGPLLVVWLLFLFGAALINQYSGRLVNGSKGFLILLAVSMTVELSVLLMGPGASGYSVGYLIGSYLFVAALPLLVAWWFSRKRGRAGIDPVTGLMATTGLTRALKILLGGQILLSLVAVVGFAMEYRLAADIAQRTAETAADLMIRSIENDRRQRLIEVLGMVLFIATAVVMFKWIYRSNHNARQLGAQGMRFTPGWAVGWFFVPVLQLWKPFQVVKEVFQASQNPADPKAVGTGRLLPFWWGVLVLDKFVGGAAHYWLDVPRTWETTQFNDLVLGGFQVTEVVFAATTLVLVSRVYRAQSLRGGEVRAGVGLSLG